MSSNINKLRKTGSVWGGDKARETGSCEDLPLDHRLTFLPEKHKGEKWTFEDNSRVCINDVPAAWLVRDSGNDVGLLCGLTDGLQEYQQHVWSRGGKPFEKFNAAIDSLQGSIGGKLRSIYEGLSSGVRFECNGDDLWINDVNLRKVLTLYRFKPTVKARRYLMGLRDKLCLILSPNSNSTRYDGVHDRAVQYYKELSLAIECSPPDAPLCLSDGSGRS